MGFDHLDHDNKLKPLIEHIRKMSPEATSLFEAMQSELKKIQEKRLALIDKKEEAKDKGFVLISNDDDPPF